MRDVFSLFCSRSHCFSADTRSAMSERFLETFDHLLHSMCAASRHGSIICSIFVRIKVNASDVVGVCGRSPTVRLKGASVVAAALGRVSIPVVDCRKCRSTLSGSKGNRSYLTPRRSDGFTSVSCLSGAVIQEYEMLLPNCVRTTAEQLLDLFTVSCFQRTKDANITRLEFMRCME